MRVTLQIPDEVSQAMRLPVPELEARLRLELAVALYTQSILGIGKSAELAGVSRWQFNSILATRGVPMHYTESELAEDLAYGRGNQ